MTSFSRRGMLKRSAAALIGAPLASSLLAGPAWAKPAGLHSAVSTPDPQAGAAAAAILRQGGNAVDAAVAALTTLCVVQPSNVGLGGYGGSIAIYLAAEQRVTTIDFDSRAPLAFEPGSFNEKSATFGHLAVGVPGVVAGLDLALSKYGTLPWKAVSRHALELAEGGIVVGARLKKSFDEFSAHADPTSLAAFFPNGAAPAAGERWVQKDLARVIGAINDGGAEAFYRGDIGRQIARHVKANGGALSDEDFRRFRALEVAPVVASYRGHALYTPPVPSAGLTSLSILKTLEHFDLASLKNDQAQYFHLFAQANKLAWQERFRWLGDPDFVKFSAHELLSDELAARRAARIRQNQVGLVEPGAPEPLHTVNVVVIDQQQNMVSLTATQGGGFGSRIVVPGTGLVLGHGMSRFELAPGPNYPQGGKRMQHNMAPMLALRDGKPLLGFGMPGGRMIVTVTPQLAIGVIDFKRTPEQALKAARVHGEGDAVLKISAGVSDAVARKLQARGHKVQREASLGGPANIALINQADGRVEAASDAGPAGVRVA